MTSASIDKEEVDEVASYLPNSELQISEEQNLEEAIEVQDTEDLDVRSECEDSSNQPLVNHL